MELRHLRYFVAVAEELHFGRAAGRLRISQQPLSRQVRDLEEELGAELFRRTTRRVELTEAGRLFLREARLALAQAEHAAWVAGRAGRGELGSVTVGFMGSATYIAVPSMLRAFRERFPGVELDLSEMSTAEQVRTLRAGRVHVGFLRPQFMPPATPEDDSLVVEAIHREGFVAALPKGHRLAAEGWLSLGDLAGEPFVLFARRLGPRLHDEVVGMCRREAGFSPNIRQEAVELQTIVGLVAAGVGVSLVPRSAQSIRSRDVVYRELDERTPEIGFAAAWRRDRLSPALESFLTLVRELAGNRSAADHDPSPPPQGPRTRRHDDVRAS